MPQGLETQIVSTLTTIIQNLGWLGIVVIMALESANIPIPSEVTMPLAGWLLVQARGGSAIEAVLLGGILGALGCLIGSVINYGVGAYGGRPFVERYGKYILISKKDIARADKWFARWGDWASFISRLLPVVRTFISFPAGVARMNFVKFVIYTFLGSFPWSLALAWAGATWHPRDVREALRPLDIPIVLVILALIVWFVVRNWRNRRPASPEATS